MDHHFTKSILYLTLALLTGCATGMRTGGLMASGTLPTDAKPEVQIITPQLLQAEKKQREQQTSQDISDLVVTHPAVYTIDSGDILAIVVWDHPELTATAMLGQAVPLSPNDTSAGLAPTGFVVDHDGNVQFPYAGVLKLAGLSEDQARNLLSTQLAHYINKPIVTLRVQAYRSKRAYIDGEVKTPGLQAINDIPMTLEEALNRAGGLLPTADQSRIMVERGPKRYQIDLRQLVQKGINPASVMLANGDVVRVLSRDESKVFVTGEVLTPKSMTMHNGRLTLNEALGEAGGVSPLTADGSQVYVVRRKAGQDPLVYRLDASSPTALAMAEEFELNPKDVVYVGASGLANWHRGISLLFPGELSSAVGAVRP